METTQPQVEQPTKVENPEAQEQTAQEQKLKIKYNHEEREITLDEAKELAQKGLNYDKVNTEYTKLKDDPSIKFTEKYAQQYGMTREELISNWEQQEATKQATTLAEEKGIDVEVAKEINELKQFKQTYESEKQAFAEAKAEEERAQKELTDFKAEYPDVKDADVPDEVLLQWKNKTPLTLAYKSYENKKLKEQLAEFTKDKEIEDVNKSNADGSTGSLGTSAGEAPTELNADIIKGMTRKQRQANMPAILKWQKANMMKKT